MTIFVRKISKAKWPSEEEIAEKHWIQKLYLLSEPMP